MSTVQENTESIFRLFRILKLDISGAIKDLFPFLEILRDYNVISNRQYDDFQESCENLIPLRKVVYKVLEELEKKNDLNDLMLLFCKQNMEAYPDLERIFERFKNVLSQNELWSEEIDRRYPNSQLSVEQGPGVSCSQESLTWSPSGPSSSDGWRCTQGTQTENCQFSIPQFHKGAELPRHGIKIFPCSVNPVNIKQENSSVFLSSELQTHTRTDHNQASEVIDLTRDNDDDKKKCSEESTSVTCQSSKEAQRASQAVGICSQGSGFSAGQWPHLQNALAPFPGSGRGQRSLSPLRRVFRTRIRRPIHQGPRQQKANPSAGQPPKQRNFRCPLLRASDPAPKQELVNSRNPPTSINTHRRRDMSDADSSSTRKRQRTTNITYAENNSTSGKHSQKQISKKRNNIGKYVIRNIKMPVPTIWKKAYMRRRINSSSQRRRKRGLTDPRQSNVDFNRPELPVTCGTAEGTLYVEKFQKGTYKKSIRSDNEEWFTPREFEIRGNLEKSKNWKKSIRCHEWTLKVLIEKELLPNPQKKKKKNKYVPDPPKKKRKLENSQQCTVCSQGWNLYPCDSCGKFYHENCHIPPVEDKSGPWSCVFCKIKDQAKFQENQAFHKESEVLKRKMLPEEQLKCELLLLTVYQEPKCSFFIHKPKQSKEDFPDLKEHMWLNKVKNRLNKKAYHSVKHFVADMRLIFHNHSIFYKDQRFSNLGDTIRKVFEENFKIFFSIKKTRKQLQPSKVSLASSSSVGSETQQAPPSTLRHVGPQTKFIYNSLAAPINGSPDPSI